jgi:hypothetical protein
MDTHIINVDFYAKNTHHRLNDECKYSFAYSLGKPSAQYCLHELSYNRNLYWNLKVYIIIQVMVHQQFFMKCLFTSEDGLQILKFLVENDEESYYWNLISGSVLSSKCIF